MTEKSKPELAPETAPDYEGNPKLEEVEALIEAKRQSNEMDESVIESIVAYVEEQIAPFTLNKKGQNGIKAWGCPKFQLFGYN